VAALDVCAGLAQSLLQPAVVFDDAVVDDGDVPALSRCGWESRRKAGMRAQRVGPIPLWPRTRLRIEESGDAFVNLALLLSELQLAFREHGNASAVVARYSGGATLRDDRTGLFLADGSPLCRT